MPMHAVFLVAAAAFLMVAMYAFRRPEGVYRRAATGLLVGLAGPFVLAYVAGPFFGSGAGLGVALVLCVFWALVILAALAAASGATMRHLWRLLRR